MLFFDVPKAHYKKMEANMNELRNVLEYLPYSIQETIQKSINKKLEDELNEIRLRTDKPLILKFAKEDLILEHIVKQEEVLKSFEKAASLDSSNDLANRSILETKNNILSIYSPQKAQTEKAEQAQKNLRAALDMTVKYMTPEFMQGLKDVVITFGETASMGGTSNIAQYENHKKTITISNAYIYAAPQVIAAYLSHESVHAHDNDPYTSIKEEQDAYQIAAKFWMKNSNGVKDPEMDYAVSLYKQSPSTLNDRVAEIYKLRDPDIADTSPNHPPKKLFHFNTSKTKAASQSIKSYDVIA